MKTTFTVRIPDEDEKTAAGIARECFALLDYLETRMSRYLEGSDVWQINQLHAGQSLFLSEPVYDCLKLAMELSQETGGLFDVTIGASIEHRKNRKKGPSPGLRGKLVIDPERPAIYCQEAGREIDLGGIGKGFALDQMKSLMVDWDIHSALLSAGPSTQLAFGSHSWNINLSGDQQTCPIQLKEAALSASGSGIQGSHILNPDGSDMDYAIKRAWIICPSAARADAWSTAMMLLNPEKLREQIPGNLLYMVESSKGIQGNLPHSAI